MPLAAELADALTAVGLPPRPYPAAALDRVQLCERDRELLARCGLPERGQPGYLRFSSAAEPPHPMRLRSLADERPKLRDSPRAQARTILAVDGSGNLLWVDHGEGDMVVWFDHDVGRPVKTNEDLPSFLRCLAAYHRFLGEHGDLATGWPTMGLGVEVLAQLRDTFVAIDPSAAPSTATLWGVIFEGRLPLTPPT